MPSRRLPNRVGFSKRDGEVGGAPLLPPLLRREPPMSISVEQWIVYVAIALLCGILGQMLAGRSIGGYVMTTVVGLLGAFLGAYIARSFGAQEPLAVTIN